MIPELGHFSLILALCLAAVMGTVPLAGAMRNDIRLMALARQLAMNLMAMQESPQAAMAHELG